MPPREAKRLTTVEINALKEPGVYAVGGVPGLLIRVTPSRAKLQPGEKDPGPTRQWVLRAMVGGKRRDIGQGGYPAVSLAQARERARADRDLIRKGIDPVEHRRKLQAKLKAEAEKRITVAKAWPEFWRDKSAGLAAGTRRHWENSMRRYGLPALGNMVLCEVELHHVEAALRPIWETKTETASKLRGRLEALFSWAAVKGYRQGDNPARWDSGLKELLPPASRVANAKHFRMLEIDQAPVFMAELRNFGSTAARCLEFVILTAVRSGEGRQARWEHIDLSTGLWSIPAETMKMKRDHIVPLPAAAAGLLERLRGNQTEGLVFANRQGGKLSDMSLLKVLRDMKWSDKTTVHGFRAVLKSWAVERTDSPDFVSEMVLAHSVGDQIQKAYQRSDLLAKRRRLMRQWSQFLGYAEPGAQVVSMAR